MDVIIDDTAERIRSLGHFAPATIEGFLFLGASFRIDQAKFDGQDFINELLRDHEVMIINLGFAINEFIYL